MTVGTKCRELCTHFLADMPKIRSQKLQDMAKHFIWDFFQEFYSGQNFIFYFSPGVHIRGPLIFRPKLRVFGSYGGLGNVKEIGPHYV